MNNSESGQALVETALVLPLLFFTAIIFFKLLFLCRTLLLMQHVAADYAQDVATEQRVRPTLQAKTWMDWRTVLFTTLPPTVNKTDRTLLRPWRSYLGISPVSERGYNVTLEIGALVKGKTFHPWVLWPSKLRVFGVGMSEPPVPSESR